MELWFVEARMSRGLTKPSDCEKNEIDCVILRSCGATYRIKNGTIVLRKTPFIRKKNGKRWRNSGIFILNTEAECFVY
jgi:hypothetical protein